MDAVAQISLYSTLFYVFLALTAIGLILAVFFFFFFDIPTVYAMITGKAKEKTLKRMQEKNAKTGTLRTRNTRRTSASGQLNTGELGNTGRTAAQVADILEHAAAPETAVLQPAAAETSVLSSAAVPVYANDEMGQTAALKPKAAVNFRFDVTQHVVLIHTDEII